MPISSYSRLSFVPLTILAASLGCRDSSSDASSSTPAPSAVTAASELTSRSTLRIAGLHAPVTLVRDEDGVVHVYAVDDHDLYFAVGWMHARDRLFQMDTMRRQASGTLASLLGSAVLADDVEIRTVGLRRAAERSYAAASVELRTDVADYAAGVNAWIAGNPLPAEYAALELTQIPAWTPVDTFVIGKSLSFLLSFSLEDLTRTTAYLTAQAVGAAAGFDGEALFFEDLFRLAPFDPIAVLPYANDPSPLAAMGPATGPEGLIRDGEARFRGKTMFANAFSNTRRPQGSNAWAIAGRWTQSGRPLLASDPHLPLGDPSTFYPMHQVSRRGGVDVFGAALVGSPYVLHGQNPDIAWGTTTNRQDVTDVYREQVVPDPTSPSGLSTVYMGQLEPVIPVPESYVINVVGNGVADDTTAPPAGSVPAATLVVPRRLNGPIVSLDQTTGEAISVQYVAFAPTQELEAFRRLDRASNLTEFQTGVNYFDVGSQNFVAVTEAGDIAYFASGEIPLREDLEAGTITGVPPIFVRDGTGGNEWLAATSPDPERALPYEIVPVAELAHAVNPASGTIVTANNSPFGELADNQAFNQLRPTGGIFYLSDAYNVGFRARRIQDEVTARLRRGKVDSYDMVEIQADVKLQDAEVFVPYILDAWDNARLASAPTELSGLLSNPRLVEALRRLRSWDFSTPTGVDEGYDASDEHHIRFPASAAEQRASVAATLYSVWRGQMLARVIQPVLTTVGLPTPGDQQVMVALRNLLDTYSTHLGAGASGIGFFDVPGVSDPYARRDIIILECLAQTLDLLAGEDFATAFGRSTQLSDYKWGKLHRTALVSPLGGPFALIGPQGMFQPAFAGLAGLPVDGGFETVDSSPHDPWGATETGFEFAHGPANRYVVQVARRGFVSKTSLPGGVSGVLGSPWRGNLLEMWLSNDTYPVRQRAAEVFGAAAEIDRLVPAP